MIKIKAIIEKTKTQNKILSSVNAIETTKREKWSAKKLRQGRKMLLIVVKESTKTKAK